MVPKPDGTKKVADLLAFFLNKLLYLVRLPHGSAVKNSSAMRKMQVQSLGGEDPLEEGMTTHSSILAGRIAWTEEPGGLWSTGSQSQTRLKRQQQ